MLARLTHHRTLLVVLLTSTLIAAVCAKLNTSGNLQVAAAATHIMIDDPDASIIDRRALTQDVGTLQKRAELYSSLTVTTPGLDGRRPPGRRARGPAVRHRADDRRRADPADGTGERGAGEPDPRVHARPIVSSCSPIRRSRSSRSMPRRRRPRSRSASRTPRCSACRTTCAALARVQGFPEDELPQMRQLGAARGGVTNSKAAIVIAALTFLTAFALSFVALLCAGSPAHAADRGGRRASGPPAARHRTRRGGLAGDDAPHALGGRGPHRDGLAHALRQDPAVDGDADRHDARPARAARRRCDLADRARHRPELPRHASGSRPCTSRSGPSSPARS